MRSWLPFEPLLMMRVLVVLVALSVLVAGEGNGWGPEKVAQHSGYITVNTKVDNGGHIFYWLFESRSMPSTAPLVLWMTGGPGCSSELAIFYEQGPYRLDAHDGSNTTVGRNAYSWNSNANVLFVDQPIGTGFSYADHDEDYVRNEKEVGEDMYEFMQAFLIDFPEYTTRPFFVTGESYAGHYVPAVAARIFAGNQMKQGLHINMQGAAIGNGMVNADIQYPEYVNFVKENNMIKDKKGLARVEKQTARCKEALREGSPFTSDICNGIVDEIQQYAGNFNVYDIREQCSYGPLCYDFAALDRLVATDAVKRSLGVSPRSKWSECNGKVYTKLAGDWFFKCDVMLVPLLEAGIPVLVYSGTEDFICNYVGGLAWVKALEWSGQDDYNRLDFSDWIVDGAVAGSYKTSGPLTFLKVKEAGHMVPMNQPANALAMLETFINGKAFGQHAQAFRLGTPVDQAIM